MLKAILVKPFTRRLHQAETALVAFNTADAVQVFQRTKLPPNAKIGE
jgi:hypothetical protein